MLKDALRNALKDQDLKARDPAIPTAESARPGADLPHPADSDWGRMLPSVPSGASIGRYQQASVALEKTWKNGGRRREAKALAAARSKFTKRYEKTAWKVIKERWSSLGYPERLYRRLKSDGPSPGPIAERLFTRRADQVKADGNDALWHWVTTGKRLKS